MASGPVGSLFVAIPRPGGALLALLDSGGRLRPGWPVVAKDSTDCGLLLPVADGSVRVVCSMENPDGNMFAPVSAFSFDSSGRSRGSWPIDAHFDVTGRMVGDDLTLLVRRSLGDVIEPGKPSIDVGLMAIAAYGTARNGARVPMLDVCCAWAVGPDGSAYRVGGDESSQIWAVDLSGVRTGWPVTFDGFASGPGFGPGGRISVVVGSPTTRTSQVLVFDRGGIAVRGRSAAIPIVTVTEDWANAGGCSPQHPQSPLVAQDGTIFMFSEEDRALVTVDASLKVMPGWPYRPTTPLVLRDERYVKVDAYCPSLAIPAVGPDSTLYLPLQASDASVGGSLVAVGPDARVRPGWPVGLKRAGSEFWSVVVGSDGTVYALAIEPESSTTSSATILAIGPDSTARYAVTLIDP